MIAVLQRAVQGGLAANGVGVSGALAPTPAPTVAPGKTLRRSVPAAPARDRVVFLGSCGVLVRTRDGRLPRDGEVEPDGAALRLSTRVGPVLLVGTLRTRPADGCFRFAVPTELHKIDVEIIRAVAPSLLAEHAACLRIAALAQQVVALACPHLEATGIPETDLARALFALQNSRLERLDS